MEKNFAIQIYQQAKTFSQRPYVYVCPELQDPRNQFNLDCAIYLVGIKDDQEQQKKIDAELARRAKKNEPRNRTNY